MHPLMITLQMMQFTAVVLMLLLTIKLLFLRERRIKSRDAIYINKGTRAHARIYWGFVLIQLFLRTLIKPICYLN